MTATSAVALQVRAKFGELTVVDEQFVERAHAEGLAVHVWMEQARAIGLRRPAGRRDHLGRPSVLVAEGLSRVSGARGAVRYGRGLSLSRPQFGFLP